MTLLTPEREQAVDRLTDHQRRVLAIAGEGLPMSQVAARIGITRESVKDVAQEIRRRLKLRDWFQIVAYASAREAKRLATSAA